MEPVHYATHHWHVPVTSIPHQSNGLYGDRMKLREMHNSYHLPCDFLVPNFPGASLPGFPEIPNPQITTHTPYLSLYHSFEFQTFFS